MKFKVLSVVFMIAMAASAYAQDAAAVTDDELKKYAVAMDSINELQAELNGTIKTMVTSNPAVSAARYNELFKIINDEGKLLDANATTDEINFVKQVIAKREEGTAKIKQTYQSLAKDYVGATAFNKVKKALTTDETLKTKYQGLMDELAKDNVVN
jgi:hypothetical protein